MSEPSLTDAERETVEVGAALFGWATTEDAMTGMVSAVERIVAARVAEAVDRERAAWAEKVAPIQRFGESLAITSKALGREDRIGLDLLILVERLLAADDTEGKREAGGLDAPRIVNSVNGEQMLAVPHEVDGTPGWRSIEGDRTFWGRRYVASVEDRGVGR